MLMYDPFICVRAVKALARLRGCAGSPEPSLLAYAIGSKVSCTDSNNFIIIMFSHEETQLISTLCLLINRLLVLLGNKSQQIDRLQSLTFKTTNPFGLY